MTAVVRGDALRIPLRDKSVDVIVTSPPYFALRSYRDGGEHYDGQIGSEPTPQAFLEALWAVTAECWRVLKDEGSMFVNLGDKRSGSGAPGTTSGLTGRHAGDAPIPGRVQGDRSGISGGYTQEAFGRAKSKQLLPHRYAIGCEDGAADPEGIGWIVRQDIVWSKPNGMPESVRDRTRDAHEYWFHLTKQGDYFAAVDEIREPYKPETIEKYEAGGGYDSTFGADDSHPSLAHTGSGRMGEKNAAEWRGNPLGKLPSSVWTIATEPFVAPPWIGVQHFAAFPSEWPRRLVLGFSCADAVVLDPFGGSGTTAMVARALGRTGISLDLSTDYCRLASWRIFQSGHGAKAVARTNGERQGVLL